MPVHSWLYTLKHVYEHVLGNWACIYTHVHAFCVCVCTLCCVHFYVHVCTCLKVCICALCMHILGIGYWCKCVCTCCYIVECGHPCLHMSSMNQKAVCAHALCFFACAYKRMPTFMQDMRAVTLTEGGARTAGLENQEHCPFVLFHLNFVAP